MKNSSISSGLYFSIFKLPIDIYIDEEHEKAFCRHLKNPEAFLYEDISAFLSKTRDQLTQKMTKSLLCLGSTEINLQILKFSQKLSQSDLEEIKLCHERYLLEKERFISRIIFHLPPGCRNSKFKMQPSYFLIG